MADQRPPHSDNVTEKTPIPPPDWEALIEVIAKEIVDERSPARILHVRAQLYDLLTHCIPATTILKVGVVIYGGWGTNDQANAIARRSPSS